DQGSGSWQRGVSRSQSCRGTADPPHSTARFTWPGSDLRHLAPSTHAGGFVVQGDNMRIYVLAGAGPHGGHANSVIAGGVDRLEGTLIRKHDPDTTAEWVPWEAALMGVGGNRESWETNSREGVRLLVERMQSHDEDVILIAYSAGNKPAHDFLND